MRLVFLCYPVDKKDNILYYTYYTKHTMQCMICKAEYVRKETSMDIQRKKGILDVCVLAVLSQESSYGYQIIQDVSKCIEVNDSTMYPILRRLENTGCVTTYSQEHNGRTRKYFTITSAGIAKINEFLAEWDEMKSIYDFVKKYGKAEGDQDE